ncbi:hypothetical protein PPYR_15393, partial [Photinus pyralis]
ININPEKTQQIIFSKKYTYNKIYSPLKVQNHIITPTNTVKYLGMYLDTRLNHRAHTTKTLQKAYATMRLAYPIMKNPATSEENKKLVYTPIIRPIITYAAPVWCNASNPTLQKLQIFQNKCLRLIANADRYTRIEYLHERTGIETIKEYINRISQHFYKTQLKHNPLTNTITMLRAHNTVKEPKHKLTYQHLPIFNEIEE